MIFMIMLYTVVEVKKYIYIFFFPTLIWQLANITRVFEDWKSVNIVL